VSISPKPGLTGESEGVANRTGLVKVRQRIEAAGRELRSRNGGLETGSRYGGAKGRCEMPVPAGAYAGDLTRHRALQLVSELALCCATKAGAASLPSSPEDFSSVTSGMWPGVVQESREG